MVCFCFNDFSCYSCIISYQTLLILVTDISELEQRLRDLPVNTTGEIDDADVISVQSEGSTEPTDYRPWENYADRALPSCE